MPRKTTILIVILAAITGILIFLAVRNETIQRSIVTNNNDPTPTIGSVPYSTLSFSQPFLDVSTGSATQTVDIVIDTAGKPVAGAQVELSYDPQVITNVRLIPATDPFFGPASTVLINSVDQEQGRISYAVGISASGEEVTGQGTLVRMSFTVNRFAGVGTTLIAFLPKSAVTTLASPSSVLSEAISLQLLLVPPSPALSQ